MPCANRDASWLTQKRRGVALNSYYNSWKAATVNSSTGGNQAMKAPCATGAEVHSEIKVGCTAAYAYNNNQVRLGDTSSSAVLGFAGLPYDANVALYPANVSRGGGHGATGTS